MFDVQHDSPVPIYEQLTSQIRAHVASGAIKPGARLAEYRALAQELLTNPQVVARAYGDLEWDGVLAKRSDGGMEVTAGAPLVCRVRLQEEARRRLSQAVAQAAGAGLAESEIKRAVEEELAASKVPPLSPGEVRQAIKKPDHESSHRASQGIQDLSRQKGAGLS
jgi:GntR family transcriptional regulator